MPRFAHVVTRRIQGRIALSALLGFAMFSATFFASTLIGGPPGALPTVHDPEVMAAELGTRELVDERLESHLKRLHGLSSAFAGSGVVVR
jgi:hypothetical protein